MERERLWNLKTCANNDRKREQKTKEKNRKQKTRKNQSQLPSQVALNNNINFKNTKNNKNKTRVESDQPDKDQILVQRKSWY